MLKDLNFKIFLSFLLVVGIFLLPNIAEAGVIPKPPNSLGLEGYWSFEGPNDDGLAIDYSGNGKTGTLSGLNNTKESLFKLCLSTMSKSRNTQTR